MAGLLDVLTGRVASVDREPAVKSVIPDIDDIDSIDEGPGQADAVTGHNCIIEYVDRKGSASVRQISCIRINTATGGKTYVTAWCHERRARRVFVVGGITQVIDAETGEMLGGGSTYFERFTTDGHFQAGFRWGLSPSDYTDLVAGLNVMLFLARCDGETHAREADEIESFVTSWWIRREIMHDIPEAEIATKIRRLAPDAEAFVMALDRASANRILRPLLAGYTGRLIEADGIFHQNELYWIQIVADRLATRL